MKKMRTFLTTLFVTTSLLMSSITVAAAETSTEATIVCDTGVEQLSDKVFEENTLSNDSAIMPYANLYGYAAGYTDSIMGSFYIDVSGSFSSRGGFTIESYSFGSSSVQIGITLYRPDGTKALDTILTGNQKIENLSFSNAPAGTYRVDYHVYGVQKGWLGGWIFQK